LISEFKINKWAGILSAEDAVRHASKVGEQYQL
jgi:hypothetical protein